MRCGRPADVSRVTRGTKVVYAALEPHGRNAAVNAVVRGRKHRLDVTVAMELAIDGDEFALTQVLGNLSGAARRHRRGGHSASP